MSLTDRERFLAMLFTAPLLAADAIVVLAGEDADQRAAVAAELYRMRPTPLYVTGGRHEAPRHQNATAVSGMLMGHGVPPGQITVDDTARNTLEQAVDIVVEAKAKGWRRVLLVASGYHLPRGYLTLLRALTNARLHETLHVVPVAASGSWSKWPVGVTHPTRIGLLDEEAEKIDAYGVRGHVATYAEGLIALMYSEPA